MASRHLRGALCTIHVVMRVEPRDGYWWATLPAAVSVVDCEFCTRSATRNNSVSIGRENRSTDDRAERNVSGHFWTMRHAFRIVGDDECNRYFDRNGQLYDRRGTGRDNVRVISGGNVT